MPDPDLLIRTSGEMRISNFLLWQIAYTEIFVTERYWPDFRGIHLLEAIADFQRRERRYGGIGEDGGEVEEESRADQDRGELTTLRHSSRSVAHKSESQAVAQSCPEIFSDRAIPPRRCILNPE